MIAKWAIELCVKWHNSLSFWWRLILRFASSHFAAILNCRQLPIEKRNANASNLTENYN